MASGTPPPSVDMDAADDMDVDAVEELAPVHVNCVSGSTFTVRAALGSTVASFKAIVAEQSNVPAGQQRLIYRGRFLKDARTLASYGLESDHTVHLVRRPQMFPDNAQRTEHIIFLGASFPVPPFDRNDGAVDIYHMIRAGICDFDLIQQQLAQNPDMMREITNLPTMQNLANGPNLSRSLIIRNPVMRDSIFQSPELGNIFNDTSLLHQRLETARNTALTREMWLNTDRARSNIESSLEGFNLLRHMHENVQEPFLDAAAATEGASRLGPHELAALMGNQIIPGNENESENTSDNNSETVESAPIANPLPNPWSYPGGAIRNDLIVSSPADGTRISGRGGLEEPVYLEGTVGDGQSLWDQLMQSPELSQLLQSLLSDPQHMNQVRILLESNTQLREILQTPEYHRLLTIPGEMERLLQHFVPSLRREHQNLEGNDTVPLEQLYATQLSQLQEMGFLDTQENIRALTATVGNVNDAVEHLLRNLGQ